MAEYNYEHFTWEQMDDAAFAAFRDQAVRVGDEAPDGELVDAASERPVRLSSLWASAPLVMEFGSLT